MQQNDILDFESLSFEDRLVADDSNTSQSNNDGVLSLSEDQYMLHPDVFAYDLFGPSFQPPSTGVSSSTTTSNNSNNYSADASGGSCSMPMMITAVNSASSVSSNSPPNDTKFAEIFTAKPQSQPRSSITSNTTRFKEPIFVAESPQNAYKKKKKRGASSSQSPSEEDDDDDNLTESDRAKLKQMTSKERRQLRNKISARNFRVRRKEYIEQLETKVREQENEIKELRETTARLQKINEALQQELQQWRGFSLPVIENTPSSGTSDATGQSPESGLLNAFNGGNNMQVVELDSIMPLFDFSFETNVSAAVMPDFDYERVFTEKAIVKRNDMSSQDLMRTYPLLVPALMSIIVGHTLTIHPLPPLPMSEDPAWNKLAPTFLWPLDGREQQQQLFEPMVAAGAGGDQHDDNKLDRISSHSLTVVASNDSDTSVKARQADEVIRKHYLYYAFMRLAGFSDKQIIARKTQKKMTPKKRPLATVTAFCSVGSTLLRHPERKAIVVSVMKNDRFANPSFSQQQPSSRHRPFSALRSMKTDSPLRQTMTYQALQV